MKRGVLKARPKARIKKLKAKSKQKPAAREAESDVLVASSVLRIAAPSFKQVLERFAADASVPAEPEAICSRLRHGGPFLPGSQGTGRIAERFPRRVRFEGHEKPEQLPLHPDARSFATFLREELKRDLYLMGVHRCLRDNQLLLGGHGAYIAQYYTRYDDITLDLIFPVPGPLPVCWEFHIQPSGKIQSEFLDYVVPGQDPGRLLLDVQRPCLRAYTEALDLLQLSPASTPKFELRSPIHARFALGITVVDSKVKEWGSEDWASVTVRGIGESNLWPSKLRLSVHPLSEARVELPRPSASSSSSSSSQGRNRGARNRRDAAKAMKQPEAAKGPGKGASSKPSLPMSAADPKDIEKLSGVFTFCQSSRYPHPPLDEFDSDMDSDFDSYFGDVDHIYYLNEEACTILVPDIRCNMGEEDFLGFSDCSERYSGVWYISSYHPKPEGGPAIQASHRTFIREALKRAFARVYLPEVSVLAAKHSAELDVWVPLPDLKLAPSFAPYEEVPGRPVYLPSSPFSIEAVDGMYHASPAYGAQGAASASSRGRVGLWQVQAEILRSSSCIPSKDQIAKWAHVKKMIIDEWLPKGKWVMPLTTLGKDFRHLFDPRRLFPDEPHDDDGYLDYSDATDIFWGPPSYPARAELFHNVPAALSNWMSFEGDVYPSHEQAFVFESILKRFREERDRGSGMIPRAATAFDMFTVETRRQDETEVDFRLCARPGLLLAKLLGPVCHGQMKPTTASFQWRLSRRPPQAPKYNRYDCFDGSYGSYGSDASYDGSDASDASYDSIIGRETGEAASRSKAGQPPLFPLLSNHDDPEHSQPPHFKRFPLRPEQLRSLQWMLTIESSVEPFEAEINDVENCRFLPHWQLEGRLRCTFMVCGGVLADKIGYGKTATTIGLVDCTRTEPPPAPPADSHHIPSRATLVLCPANLHVQWINEIKKFTGTDLNVVSLQTFAQLKSKTVQELMEADFVVATYRLFYSQPYLAHLAALVRQQTGRKFAFPKIPDFHHFEHSDSRSAKSLKFEQAYTQAVRCLEEWTVQKLRSQRRGIGPLKGDAGVKRRCLEETLGMAPKRPSRSDDAYSDGLGGPPDTYEDASTWKQRCNVPLEVFWWRRIVVDEFHELLTNYPPAQIAVRLFRSTARWGLSGTPPCSTVAEVQKSASFFNCHLGGGDAASLLRRHGGRDAAQTLVWQKLNCQKWLDRCVRQNTAGLAELKCDEKIILVHQHSAERAIYLQLSQAPNDESHSFHLEEEDEYHASQRSLDRRESLLKLCSHFQLTGAQLKSSAADECEAVLKKRRKETIAIKAAFKRALEASARASDASRPWEWLLPAEEVEDHLAVLDQELAAAAGEDLLFNGSVEAAKVGGGEPSAMDEAKAFGRCVLLEVVASNSTAQAKRLAEKYKLPQEPEVPSVTKQEQEKYDKALAAWKLTSNATGLLKEVRSLHSSVGVAVSVAKQKLKAVEGKVRQLRFFEQTLRAQRLEEAVECPVCFEQTPVHERCILPCAHVGCTSCFMRTMAEMRKCPVCRAPVQAKELMCLAPPAATSSSWSDIARAAKYGSKIQALVGHLRELLKADPENRIILFVQWEDLRQKVGSALQEFGVLHTTLEGNVWRRRDTILQFQGDAEGIMPEPKKKVKARTPARKQGPKSTQTRSSSSKEEPIRILLLSLEHSASGTNFTAANHVVLFHPMLTDTTEAGSAFEMQAIGRALRYGQQRTVEVWRFVTADTVEQQITEKHSEELWQRFRAQRVVGASSSSHSSVACTTLESSAVGQASSSGCRDGAAPSSSGARSSTD